MPVKTKKHKEGIFYQCCSCNVWWRMNTENVGIVADVGIYCPACSEELRAMEIEVWHNHLQKFGLPNDSVMVDIKHIVWKYVALPSEVVNG